MTWSNHIQLKVNKATKVLNFIKHTLHKCTNEVKETACFTLVRPVLEYAAIIWDPYQQCLIDDIEKIQRRAARWVTGDYRFTSRDDINTKMAFTRTTSLTKQTDYFL